MDAASSDASVRAAAMSALPRALALGEGDDDDDEKDDVSDEKDEEGEGACATVHCVGVRLNPKAPARVITAVLAKALSLFQ